MRALCATDLSAASEAAIENETCLECLGRIGVDTIHLVTVVPANVHSGMPGVNFEERRRQGLNQYRQVIEAEGFDVDVHVVRGTPHRRINGLADRVDASLVIVGSRGKSPLEERFIGGTARDMIRTATRPLLLERIRRESDDDYEVAHEHLFRRIMYATDFSENAERAFDQFRHLKHATQEATLVHVAPPERRSNPEAVEDVGGRLEELADELREKGIDDVRTMVRTGEATEEILAAEAEVAPTTVLMGVRGRSRIRRLLVGSTSETIAARSDSNVLLVPPTRQG